MGHADTTLRDRRAEPVHHVMRRYRAGGGGVDRIIQLVGGNIARDRLKIGDDDAGEAVIGENTIELAQRQADVMGI